MVKKYWMIGIIVLIFLISSIFVGAYCNETREIYHANETNPSSDYNMTITRTCTNDSEFEIIGSAVLIFAIIVLFGYLGYIYSKEESYMFYLCYGFWYMALLMPLFGIRILAHADGISTTLKDIMNTLYVIYVYFYWVMVLFLVIYFVVLLLSWLWFWHKKPAWKRKKLEL